MNAGNARVASLVAGVVIFLATLGALVALEITGHDDSTDTVLTLAGPVVAALLVTGHVSSVTDQQNTKIDQIASNTNGTLDKRIRDQTLTALVEAGVVQAPAALPPTAPPPPAVVPTPAPSIGRHYDAATRPPP